jgi:hypothetical protein
MFVIAIEIMIRFQYNAFGDPALLVLLPYTLLCCAFVMRLSVGVMDAMGMWNLKHKDTAWHATLGGGDDDLPDWDDLEQIKGASHEQYLMNQRITSETFRFKFLDYNRPWLVAQLPAILTPRTLRRSRPYLIAQFTRILGSVNPEVSEDSDSDDDGRPRFGPVSLNASSRAIIRLWLAQARRRRRLLEAVQDLIALQRKGECEKCLSRKGLVVDLVIPIEVLADRFEAEQLVPEFDQVKWKKFFQDHEQFRTLCLTCLGDKRKALAEEIGDSSSDSEVETGFGPVFLTAASRAIVLRWYGEAQDNVRMRGGHVATGPAISDDEEGDDHAMEWAGRPLRLSAASRAIARKWLLMARTRQSNFQKAMKKQGLAMKERLRPSPKKKAGAMRLIKSSLKK